MGCEKKNLEIERILHLKSEIRNRRLDLGNTISSVQSAISDFGLEMQDSCTFKILFPQAYVTVLMNFGA
jgi:hypothetical protein